MFSLEGKVALVTGAAGLLGRNHCAALLENGAVVIACDLSFKEEQIVKGTIPYEMDVTHVESIKHVFKDVLDKYETIDVLVNNAAVNEMFEDPKQALELSKFENFPIELWQKSLDVNLTGTFLCSQIFGTHMAGKRSGSIINIASTYGIVGPDQSIYLDPAGFQNFYKSAAYPATKSGVIGFTKFLASYWGAQQVRVNALSPGGVENQQESWFVKNYASKTCLKRMANPSDYKGALVFLASDASTYMTGANLVVDGGWTAI